jgi:hypothetical protein
MKKKILILPGLSDNKIVSSFIINFASLLTNYEVHSKFYFRRYEYFILFGTIKINKNFFIKVNIINYLKFFYSLFSKNIITLESPVVGRSGQFMDHRDKLFRIGLNGFFANKGYSYALKNKQSQVNYLHFTNKYNILFKKIKFNKSKYIGIVLQIPSDNAIKGFNQAKWIEKFLDGLIIDSNYINKYTYILRLPPLINSSSYNLKNFEKYNNIIIEQGTNDNRQSFLDKCKFIITFSSTMGIDAIVNGTPAIGIDSRSFLNLVSSNKLIDLFNNKFLIDQFYKNIISNTTWDEKLLSKTDFDFFIK